MKPKTKSKPAGKLMTVKEAADYLGVSIWTIYNLVHAKRLTGLNLTGTTNMVRYVTRASVEKLVTEE